MADEKARHGFDGRPLVVPSVDLGPDSDAYMDTTRYVTKDGRLAAEVDDGEYFLADGVAGEPRLDQPISKINSHRSREWHVAVSRDLADVRSRFRPK